MEAAGKNTETVVLADELIETAAYDGEDDAKHPHDRLDNKGENKWDKWTAYVQDKENAVWKATLKATPHNSARADFKKICVRKKALFRRNTLCIARKSNAFTA